MARTCLGRRDWVRGQLYLVSKLVRYDSKDLCRLGRCRLLLCLLIPPEHVWTLESSCCSPNLELCLARTSKILGHVLLDLYSMYCDSVLGSHRGRQVYEGKLKQARSMQGITWEPIAVLNSTLLRKWGTGQRQRLTLFLTGDVRLWDCLWWVLVLQTPKRVNLRLDIQHACCSTRSNWGC